MQEGSLSILQQASAANLVLAVIGPFQVNPSVYQRAVILLTRAKTKVSIITVKVKERKKNLGQIFYCLLLLINCRGKGESNGLPV